MFPTLNCHRLSTTTLKTTDITAATVGAKTPAATPTARANARARLFCTRMTVAPTVIGRMITVCTTDWSYPERRLVSMYTQATGSTSTSAVSIESRVTHAHSPCDSVGAPGPA